jgi:probable HAF family extracellular repeat protein
LLVLALLLGWTATLSADVLYSVTDLGTLGGGISGAFGINNAGQVTGYADTADGTTHAFLYRLGTVRQLHRTRIRLQYSKVGLDGPRRPIGHLDE